MPARYLTWVACLLLVPIGAVLAVRFDATWWWLSALAFALSLLGVRDYFQTRRALLRNYPLLAHFRYLIESIRPEIRQYLLEGEEEQTPFSRAQRSIVYQRAKNTLDKRPFGTQLDVYRPQYEWINHSLQPVDLPDHDFRIRIGGPDCALPYSASVFNISAMSFGSLSAAAIRALNAGAKRGGFYHDTGEGSISRHHREHGGDLVWEIGSGYFGCRDEQGRFSEQRFALNAQDPQVKMIELKLSQGAKPGQGGILPAAKVTPEIAEARGVPVGQDCLSPARHSAFDTPTGLLRFIARLRELSGGKPVGFKLAVGHPWEWFGIARAMQETGITPDFIVVDGGEGGTGAAPLEFTNHVGAPLTEALILIHNTLVGLDLRDRIRIGAAGKLVTAFDIARTLAIGADWCNSARGFMFALGCIQSQSCHTDRCPTGVATQDPRRQRALVVPDKAERVFHFQQNTLKALRDLLAASGLTHPDQLGPEHIIRRVSGNEIRSLANLHFFVKPGELLQGVPRHPVFELFWPLARADCFSAPAPVKQFEKQRA
ncbi:MAG: FMN-binding glutamate synthase family protein [Aquimonas sp.]|nr:FMN-binding glutamate synthase family protein [Aquimonas sp.]